MQTLELRMPVADPQETLSIIATCARNLRSDLDVELLSLESGSVPVVVLKPKQQSALDLIYIFSVLGKNDRGEFVRGFSIAASFCDRPLLSVEMVGTSAAMQIVRDLVEWRPNAIIDSMTRSRLEMYTVRVPEESADAGKAVRVGDLNMCLQHESHVSIGDTCVIVEQIGQTRDSPTLLWRLTAKEPDFESGMIHNESVDLDSFEDVLCVLEQVSASETNDFFLRYA